MVSRVKVGRCRSGLFEWYVRRETGVLITSYHSHNNNKEVKECVHYDNDNDNNCYAYVEGNNDNNRDSKDNKLTLILAVEKK